MLLRTIPDMDEGVINAITDVAFLGDATPVQIPVYYLNPEEEFTPEVFPVIVVYRVGTAPDTERLTLKMFRGNYVYNQSQNLVSLDERESPLSVNFWYVVRLYYEFNEDGAEMNRFMLKNFPPAPKPCFITIDEEDYDFLFINHSLFASGDKNFGNIEFKDKDNRRVFCDQYIYIFKADFDIFDPITVKTVTDITINLVVDTES